MASIPVPGQLPSSDDFAWRAIGVCERLGSAVMLAGCSPILGVSAVAVSLLSGRTPFIAHKRVGWRGATLWMLKLRTMWGSHSGVGRRRTRWVEYIDDETGPARKQARDPRVPSWFARFCRRHSIDELPQLWHVIKGEMALVGPRPLTPWELRQHYGTDGRAVFEAKPGLAGLWQVSGRNRLSYAERRELDLEFVRRRSLRLYFRILLRTVPEILSGSDSW
ncbi:MAG: sugar transferase [Candidatus Sulfopaludibacter sp.]|nr:sugar transferase [Candidatus Sulfopaludibacter sp.]